MVKKNKLQNVFDEMIVNESNKQTIKKVKKDDFFESKNRKAEEFLAKTKTRLVLNTNMVQTSIYTEANVEFLLRKYTKYLNEYLKFRNKKFTNKVKKQDLVNNILYDFIVKNDLKHKDYNDYSDRVKELDALSENMLEIIYKDLPLKSLLNREFVYKYKTAEGVEKQVRSNLYLNFEILEYLCYSAELFYNENENGKTTFINVILKKWFIDNEIVDNKYFSTNKEDSFVEKVKTVIPDFEKSDKKYDKYFEIENKFYDDNFKFNDEDKIDYDAIKDDLTS